MKTGDSGCKPSQTRIHDGSNDPTRTMPDPTNLVQEGPHHPKNSPSLPNTVPPEQVF